MLVSARENLEDPTWHGMAVEGNHLQSGSTTRLRCASRTETPPPAVLSTAWQLKRNVARDLHLATGEAVVAAGPWRIVGFAKHYPLAALPCGHIRYQQLQQLLCQLLRQHIPHNFTWRTLPQLLIAYWHLLCALGPVTMHACQSDGLLHGFNIRFPNVLCRMAKCGSAIV